ncbi:FAD-dependent monooxygenase [Streptomyces sp. GMY02]|uniref:FAD-dependent monooxygenase n=1 Tax=Streptomyces sp. GMY02 TaxID=1333528 RepID=UPI001C2C34E3|nr:FAD-dependent monooxygenase [Streptomyces sp. GMY02]QXE33256.1 FAD-dependent monooxygenase [Streptomyces sp. GMY02]
MSSDSAVVIVGAGPVGLVLAAELETAGVHAVIVEQLAEPDPLQKGRGVGVLGSEALRRRGLGRRLFSQHQAGKVNYQQDMGSPLGHFAWIHKLTIDHLVHETDNRVPAAMWQPELEKVLADHATKLGATLLRSHRVTALTQDESGVELTVATPDGDRRFRTSYVVGCDGGRSAVRKLADFDFPGVDGGLVTRIARLKVADPETFPAPVNSARGRLQHGGVHDGWVRVRVTEPVDESEDRDHSPLTETEVRDAVHRTSGVHPVILEMREGRRTRDNSRHAASYRMGRVFLAGDAAHVHSPMGGQGLNLGIMDAVNLGWKLATVVQGTVDARLLDTYTAERHPVGWGVVHNTRAQTALLPATPYVEALRDIVTDLLDLPQVNRHIGGLLSGIDVRYQLPYAPGTDHELIGGHIPDLVVDDVTLYSLMHDGRPVLLHTPVAGSAAVAAQPWADRLHLVDAIVLGRRDLTAALIRPDGVLAWAATPNASPDNGALVEALSTWFGTGSPRGN